MPLLLPAPVLQFCDANGAPYAGGTIDTYIPGTDTLKQTWQDHLGSVLNTNPIILDAAGRALIYGDGEYRFVLKDSAGNLIYDQLTDSVISDVMLPVVQSTSLSSARDMLGVTDAIQTETDRATAAESAEQTRALAAEATLQNNITAETTRATAAETALQTSIGSNLFQDGIAVTDSSGHVRVTFPRSYSATPAILATIYGTIPQTLSVCAAADTTGADIYVALSGTGVSVGVTWLSYGAA